MRRIIIMTFILGLAASVAWAQDTTKVTAPCACFLSGGGCGCRVRPVNDYSGLNSLRSRLANPSWDGRLSGIGTGLRLEEGRIRPLSGTTIRTEPDTPETSSATFADKSHSLQDPYLEEVGRGETPFGAPVFVFFRLAGTCVTDAPQLVGINAAADLAVERNMKVRITGSADSATGSSVKNDAIALSRAEHVAGLMEKRGVSADRIEVLSVGETDAYGSAEANRNCRIELFMQ